jgi:uncharacterized membrane protein HdeD (DUF308 family)
MANVNDYVRWRGDISFSERGFKTEDNLVLSEMVYIDYKPVMEGRTSMTLREAITALDEKSLLKNTRAGSTRDDLEFARHCAASERFGNVVLSDFKDEYDSSDRQFAAVTYHLDDGTTVIGFRGTDSTIIGWKEDFMISYTLVPSQDLAYEYASKHVDAAEKDVIILGHSKGANLALYASAHLSPQQQEKLRRVYINDGPGFCDDVLNKEFIYRILSKITKITPEYSIIGRIFEPPAGESIIVRSSAMAMLQHSISTWMVDPDGIVSCSDHAPESHLITDLIDRFVEGMDLNARENFIESLFGSMADTGVSTIKEFAAQGPAVFENLLINMAGDDALAWRHNARKMRKEDDDNRNIFTRIWGFINRKEFIRIGLSLALCALCFTFPDFAMETVVFIVLLFICIYEVVLTIKHLRDSGWDFRKERPRVMLCIVLWVLSSAVILKEGALFVISSMILGVFFLSLAYQNIINFRIFRNKFFERFRYSFEGIVTLFLGSYILITPDIENSWYMYSCGYLLLIDAIFETLKIIRDRKKHK